MRTTFTVVVAAALALTAGCSDDAKSTDDSRFPGLASTTVVDLGGATTTLVGQKPSDVTTSTAPPTTVPRPGIEDARKLVDVLFEPTGKGADPDQKECLANSILDRISESSIPDIIKMTREQYPPGLADDLNASMTGCLPEDVLAKVVI